MSDRHELERLLREQVERLSPPEGMWEQIEKRARRRRWLSAGASVAAVVVIVAGAVPAVLAVRHNADNQTLSLKGNLGEASTAPKVTSSVQPAPVPQSPLAGFFPESLSFVSQSVGYLWGSTGTSPAGVVAKTTDGGKSWVQLGAPPVKNEFVAQHGAAQIRFASGTVGFLYGSMNYITTDAGATWHRYDAPGYIADLEAVNQRIWALVRPRADSDAIRLYSATASKPTLRPVSGVPLMHGLPGTPEIAGAASIALSGNHVDVIAGGSAFYSSADGKRWAPRHNPCPSTAGPVRTALVSTTTTLGVAVACGYDVNEDSQTKQLFESTNSGRHWTKLSHQPSSYGLLQTLSGGSVSDIMIGTTRGGAQVTHDGGESWTATGPTDGAKLSFVGFINPHHVVAVADRTSASTGSFATSYDSGKIWRVTGFGTNS